MFCYNCGTQMSDTAKFCPKCGTEYTWITENSSANAENPKDMKVKGNTHRRKLLFAIWGSIIVLCCVLSLLYICFPTLFMNKKQEALLQYINHDIKDLGKLETEFLESYGSVTGENYVNDMTMYTEFTNNTIELARKLNDEAVELADSITDDELLEVHRLYMNYSNKCLNAVTLFTSALENQDYALVVEANEVLNEANNCIIDYRKELKKLANEYHVEIDI